jgi:hypothetical protein
VLRTVGIRSALATATTLILGALTFVLEGRWPGIASYVRDFDNTSMIVWVLFALIALFFVPTVAAIHIATPPSRRLSASPGSGSP